MICEGVSQLSSDLPSIECAICNNISDEEMFLFVYHTSNLRSFTTRISDFCSDVDLSDLNIVQLTHLNIRLENNGLFESLYHF